MAFIFKIQSTVNCRAEYYNTESEVTLCKICLFIQRAGGSNRETAFQQKLHPWTPSGRVRHKGTHTLT